MQNQLFIPKTIKVGFQKRSDTFTGNLAYIIYFDAKGILRKEKSWEGWRDKKIKPLEMPNSPHAGFVLNKSVKRDSSYFGNGRNMIRVYDDRGFEFEVTTGNLLFNLMTVDCLKREFQGEFVYAWYGTELVMLPVDCDEYRNSVGFSELQGKDVSAKELILGATYETKQQNSITYLGKFPWYEAKYYRDSGGKDQAMRVKSRRFVFWDGKKIVSMNDIKKLSHCISDICCENYAELMAKFSSRHNSSKIVSVFNGQKQKLNLSEKNFKHWAMDCYFMLDEKTGEISRIKIRKERANHYALLKESGNYYVKNGELYRKGGNYYYGHLNYFAQFNSIEEVNKYTFQNCMVELENGEKYELSKLGIL